MFQNSYTPLNHRKNYIRNRYNTFNMQSHHISNERVTKINKELYTHEDNIIIDMKLDNERIENTENEEIINEELSDKNSSKLSNKEKSGEKLTKESNEEPDRGEKVIDESLKNEYIPHISREFVPYFSNIMEALMFC